MRAFLLALMVCSLLISGASAYPLPGWNGTQVQITIASTDIPQDLTNFPVLIHLSSSSGKTHIDMTDVFSQLGNSAQKIAVTESDGATQCYVEIESWDAQAREAWLWVKVPSLSTTQNTTLYLYYDPAHADNTEYVGYTGSTPAMNVWDAHYVGVWHMNPTGDVVPDSTSEPMDGILYGGSASPGKIGRAISFPGSLSNVTATILPIGPRLSQSMTLESWIDYAGGSSPVLEPGFETADSWTFYLDTQRQNYTGSLTTAWKTQGTYSYQLQLAYKTKNIGYGEISQNVDLSQFSRMWFDCQTFATGISSGAMSSSVLIDDSTTWVQVTPLSPTEYLNQFIDISNHSGIKNIQFRFSNNDFGSGSKNAAGVFRVDNIRVDMGSIAESPNSFGLFFRGLDSDADLAAYINSQYAWAPTITHGTWHEVDQTYDKTAITVYTDGISAAQSSYMANVENPDTLIMGQYFNGAIDEIRISDTVRSPAWRAASKKSADDDLLTFSSSQSLFQIDVNGAINNWALSIGENTDTTNLTLTVKSPEPWAVTVYDALDDGKPAESAGHMTEYIQSGYNSTAGGRELYYPARMNYAGGPSFVDLSGIQQTLVSGPPTPPAGTNFPLVVNQTVDFGDIRLTPPSTYQIVVTFVGNTL